MERDKLFRPLEDFGDSERPRADKVEVIGRADDMLAYLGADARLVSAVADARIQTEPLSTLVLARQPIAEERLRLEGRGAYHRDISLSGRSAIVYVKSTGNEHTFEEGSEAPFPGFPAKQGKLFFDSTFLSRHPRMVGTETLTWGLLELINSSVLFTQLSAKYGWTSLEEAINAGVTIPLNVTHFRELSDYLQGLLQKMINTTDDKLILDSLKWQGNFIGIGSVTQIVPSDRRLTGGIVKSETREETIARLTDPKVTETTGRTLRELFDAGYVYSQSSSHGQNLYDCGLVAQADNSDLVYLGDYKGERNFEWSQELTLDIPAEVKRMCLVFKQFERADFLTPLYYPVPELHVSWDSVVAIQERFWGSMLDGYVHPNAIPAMAKLMPYLRNEMNLALAQTLIQGADQQKWELLADHKKQLINQYADYGVPEEYERKLEDNLDDTEFYPLMSIIQKDKVPVKALQLFLQSGDLQDLLQDRRTAEVYELAQVVENIVDKASKERIIQWIGNYFGRRDIDSLYSEPDQIAAFEGAHIRMLTQLAREERYEEVVKTLETLVLSANVSFGSYYSLKGTPERIEYYYPRMLLEGEEVPEVYEQCRFDYFLFTFASDAYPFSLVKIASDIINKGEVQKEEYNISDYAKDHSLPTPREAIRKIIGSYQNDKISRAQITDWLITYFEKRAELANEEDPNFNILAVEDQLDHMAARVKDRFPELSFGHAAFMANRCRSRDTQRASEYYNTAMLYYQQTMEKRQTELSVSFQRVDDNSQRDSSQFKAISERYRTLGLPLIAKRYANYAKGKYLEHIW